MNLKSGSLSGEKKQWLSGIVDFTQLVKIRLSSTVVFSALLSYWIALPLDKSLGYKMFSLVMGGFLVTGAANALNQVLEKNFDALMDRTSNRPLPSGRMDDSTAIFLAGIMSVSGIIFLASLSLWSALIGAISLLIYAFVYTPVKRISSAAVFIGAIPGALPVLIGTVSAQGEFTILGLGLFAIQFFWQFPHFWSISWLGHHDYMKAGFKITPSLTPLPTNKTGFQAFIYSLFLLPVLILCAYTGILELFSLSIAFVFTLLYIVLSYKLFINNNKKAAMSLLFFSFLYIPILLGVFLIDKFN
jgi:protoheme IX farnesyltransferase